MTTGLTIDRALLFAGIAAGLLFFIVPTIEVFRRPGFDIQRHAISVLSLGDGGWIMKAVFIVCGITHTYVRARYLYGAGTWLGPLRCPSPHRRVRVRADTRGRFRRTRRIGLPAWHTPGSSAGYDVRRHFAQRGLHGRVQSL